MVQPLTPEERPEGREGEGALLGTYLRNVTLCPPISSPAPGISHKCKPRYTIPLILIHSFTACALSMSYKPGPVLDAVFPEAGPIPAAPCPRRLRRESQRDSAAEHMLQGNRTVITAWDEEVRRGCLRIYALSKEGSKNPKSRMILFT